MTTEANAPQNNKSKIAYGFAATGAAKDEIELYTILTQKFSDTALTIHQNVACIEFIQGIPQAESLLEKGRTFNEKIEVRWQKRSKDFHIIALSEDSSLLQDLQIAGEKWETKVTGLLLWGEYNEPVGQFIEVRIPRLLNYPKLHNLKDGCGLQIRAYNYLQNGIIQFTRYRKIIRIKPNQK